MAAAPSLPAPAATQPAATVTGGSAGVAQADDRQLVRFGVGGAMLSCAALLLFQIFAVRPYASRDEGSHVDYALALAHGDLPAVGTPLDSALLGRHATSMALSYHPPLYHAAVGGILRLGLAVHHPLAGFYAARLLTAACMVVLVGLVAMLALSFPGRRRAQVAVAAAALVAAFAPLQTASAAIMNDAPIAALATGALVAVVRIVRFGATRARLLGVTACCAAGMLTKVSMVGVLAIAVLALLIAAVLPGTAAPQRSWPRRLGTGLAQAMLPVAASAAAAGWFYLLNLDRYGSLTGEGYGAGDRSPDGPVSLLTDPGAVAHLWQQLFGGAVNKEVANPRYVVVLAAVCAALLAAGGVSLSARTYGRRTAVLALSAWTYGRRTACGWRTSAFGRLLRARTYRRRTAANLGLRPTGGTRGHAGPDAGPDAEPVAGAGGEPSGAGPDHGRTVLAVGVLAAALAAPLLQLAEHAGLGGGSHGRYLAPGVAGFGLAAAVVLVSVPWLRGGWAVLVVFAAEIGGVLASRVGVLVRPRSAPLADWFHVFSSSLAGNGVPAAPAVLVVLLLAIAAGMVGVAAALWRLGAQLRPAAST